MLHLLSIFAGEKHVAEHLLQQAEGGLVGSGASASVLPGPITEGASYYTAPAATGTAPAYGASSTSSGSSSTSTPKSGALALSASSMLLSMSGALMGGLMAFA